MSLCAAIAACALGDDDKPSGDSANLASVNACLGGVRPSGGYGFAPAFNDISFRNPIAVAPLPGDNEHFLVVEKAGVINYVANDGTRSVALDIKDRVNSSPNEAGLLGLALHPKFAENGLAFLSYTKPSSTSPANLASVIVRIKSNDGGKTFDKTTLTELLQFDQPYSNHNGGHVAFGPDGRLYASFGDGGSGGDPRGYGQNKDVFLGKMLRIDVDVVPDGQLYGIPEDNPFANGGGKPEIYAYGLRNTWRFNFDSLTGELWAGDVGQNRAEEVDKITLGGNYGWGVREGFRCYKPEPCPVVENAIDPIVEYGRSMGFSITGGYVYRGTALPELQGRYIFGDFGGKIYSIPTTVSPTPPPIATVALTNYSISSFGQDNDGELFILDYGAGKVKRLVPQLSSEGLPAKLSQTGCVLANDPKTPSSKLLAYDVTTPLWSDGAEKYRWISLPPDGKINVAPDGHFDLPNGTVLVKEFRLGGKRIETRLFVRHTDSSWAGYTYEWNADESDALLLLDGKTKEVPNGNGAQVWTYPSRSQCMQCHNGAAGGSLGLEIGMLNMEHDYPADEAGPAARMNQLAKLEQLGAFAAPLPAEPRAKFPNPADESVDVEARARSYVHANCAFCHRPGGPGRGAADFRFSRTFKGTKVCEAEAETGDLGVPDGKLFVPGDPSKSLISLRMHTLDGNRMPPLASAIVDPIGTSVVDGWITTTLMCPY
ncbi:MAG: PQQ-dependent sugar dehydrogenase [Labilithrix sp.]|nr:PQQ-dependent sugar dehydrogenase [Labilithrix sp.]MCW5815860.1 PQQ-dependent sugar dehydrogenase [Labilithrix sp.]